jgi:hypothetical protein
MTSITVATHTMGDSLAGTTIAARRRAFRRHPVERLGGLGLQRGRIVGSVEIVNCVEHDDRYAWVLENPRRYKKPIEPKGTPQPDFWFPRF